MQQPLPPRTEALSSNLPDSFKITGEVFENSEILTRHEFGLNAATPNALKTLMATGDLAGLGSLDGIFALAWSQTNHLKLYVDASNLCPQYWTRSTNSGPQFDASPLQLLSTLRQVPCIARTGLHEFLRLLDIAAPRTFFDSIFAVPPGSLLTLDVGEGARADDCTTGSGHEPAASFDEAVGTLDQILKLTIARRLTGANRPATFLSGGIDSAVLCAMAAKHDPRITAITVGFEGSDFDESPAAAGIASHLGVTHQVLRFGRSDYLEAFDCMARGMNQPMADPATMATLLAFGRCKEQFDVVLDGTGADEAVGAMPPRHARLAVGFGSMVPKPLRQLLVHAMSRVPLLAGYTPLLDFEHPAETLMRWKGFSRAEIEALCGESVSLEDTTFYRTFASFPRHCHYERYSALLNAMPCDRLVQAMRLTGLRVRFPFCARDVDAYLRQLPTEWRHVPGRPKRILRDLLARYVPPAIWDRPKQGFTFPLQNFLAGEDHALVRRHAIDGRWLDRGILQPDRVRQYARQYIEGDRRLMFRVWALVVLGAWLDAHEDLVCASPRA